MMVSIMSFFSFPSISRVFLMWISLLVASEEEVDAAVARTSSELRSIDAVNQTRGGLHTALMVLIDYKGFRIQAYADMGIDSKVIYFSKTTYETKDLNNALLINCQDRTCMGFEYKAHSC